jgi:hypothetical protein
LMNEELLFYFHDLCCEDNISRSKMSYRTKTLRLCATAPLREVFL